MIITRISKKYPPSFTYLFRYLLLPNIVFGILSLVTTTTRAWINIDYCLVGLVSPLIGRYWAVALYLVFFLLDIFASFAMDFHLQPVILLTIFRELSAFNPIYLTILATLLIIPLIVMWFLAFKKEQTTAKTNKLGQRKVLLIVPVALIILDVLNGSNGMFRLEDKIIFNYNIIGSALVRTIRDIKTTISKKSSPPNELLPQDFATSSLFRKISANEFPKGNIVLVVVESWGVSSDKALDQGIINPLLTAEISSRYDMKTGRIPFRGATVSAELRELYGIRASDPAGLAARKALPEQLKSRGYETYALHGFMPSFFGRSEWYPHAGFEHSYFVDELDSLMTDHSKCGSTLFQGICDESVPGVIKYLMTNQQHTDKPKFIYWLTLNSHYPFAYPDKKSDFRCERFPLSKQHEDVCNLSSMIYSTFSVVAQLIADPDIPPTHFIMVGDHSPPFLMRSKNGMYSKQFVPMIEFSPKIEAGDR